MASSKSKAIIVTGGARGIGRCLARTFLQNGHRVFIIDIEEEELTHTTKTHLKQYSDRVSSSLCNLRDVQAIRNTVKKAADFFGGKIDVLINNGGIAAPYWKDGKTMADPETIDEWQAYVETNLTASFAMSQACIPFMKHDSHEAAKKQATSQDDAGPCIIHIGSFRALQSDPNQEGYAATKAGQLGLTHAMAISCEPWGIRVNLIAPGRMRATHECKEADEKGEEWQDIVGEEDIDDHPVNRPGKAEDIAQAAEFLMEAGFITGQDITVDGGASKKKRQL